MKGFIEVTLKESGQKLLVNINCIERICDNIIEYVFRDWQMEFPEDMMWRYFSKCTESYEELKALIEEAQK